MERTYRLTPGTRMVNWVFSRMTWAGIGASYRYVLTVGGRHPVFQLTPAGQP
jgi:hypothetical protein